MPNSKNPFATAKELMKKNALNAATETEDQNNQADNSASLPSGDILENSKEEFSASSDRVGRNLEEIPENIAKLLAGPKSKKSHMVPMLLDFALKEIKERENSALKARGEKGTKKTEDDYVIQAMVEFFSVPGLRADCLNSAAKKLKSIL